MFSLSLFEKHNVITKAVITGLAVLVIPIKHCTVCVIRLRKPWVSALVKSLTFQSANLNHPLK